MTEITDANVILPEVVKRFVLEWGNLGERWGVNRSVSQIHALLYASKNPLAAEEIADLLGIARSNVSNSLRELQTWNIIRSVASSNISMTSESSRWVVSLCSRDGPSRGGPYRPACVPSTVQLPERSAGAALS